MGLGGVGKGWGVIIGWLRSSLDSEEREVVKMEGGEEKELIREFVDEDRDFLFCSTRLDWRKDFLTVSVCCWIGVEVGGRSGREGFVRKSYYLSRGRVFLVRGGDF